MNTNKPDHSTSRSGELDTPALSAWFPADMNPASVGVYQIRFYEDGDWDERWPEYHYWDGRRWWYGDNTPDRTSAAFLHASKDETEPTPKPWRGLANKPARSA